jgi:putative transcriptional regulator
MPPSLAPALLLSMPQLLDPNFSRTVVLLCKHTDEGAFGLVVNRPLVTTGTVTVTLDPPVTTERELQVWVGGPVELERSWILVGRAPADPQAEDVGIRVADDLYLSTSPDLLRRMLEPEPPPRMRLVIGYAGWGPGQLDGEIIRGDWTVMDADPETVFSEDPSGIWEKLSKMGEKIQI